MFQQFGLVDRAPVLMNVLVEHSSATLARLVACSSPL